MFALYGIRWNIAHKVILRMLKDVGMGEISSIIVDDYDNFLYGTLFVSLFDFFLLLFERLLEDEIKKTVLEA